MVFAINVLYLQVDYIPYNHIMKKNRILLYAILIAAVFLLCFFAVGAFPTHAAGMQVKCGLPWIGQVVCIALFAVVSLGLCVSLALHLRQTRVVLALFFIIGTTLLFLDFTGTMRGITGWMAKAQLLPAVLALNAVAVAVVVVLTLVFGRVYCSFICPLGIMQDAIARLGRIRRRNPYNYSKEKKWLRYGVLVVFLALLVGGVGTVAALVAPYSAFGRIAQNILQPIWIAGNNVLASVAEACDSYTFYHTDLWIRSLPTFFIALATLFVIGLLAWRNGRTWCNTICPVGTVLSFLSRFSWLKIHFDESKCRQCSKCSRNCKAACIDYKTHTVDYSRCVACGDCLVQCEFAALTYGHRKRTRAEASMPQAETTKPQAKASETTAETTKPLGDAQPVDGSRRAFLVGAALATSAAALAQKAKKVDGGLATLEKKVEPKRHTPLTPPGSWSADNFAEHCTACQLCVAECPNGVLRPSIELDKLMQPTMSFERGACRPECTRCSEVCPTGAIKPITRAEKSSTQIGHAVWIKQNCVVLTDKVECGNCARHCPAGAIEMMPLDPNDDTSPFVPAVNEARCIGCGECEYVCPARPFSAIHVEGHEVHRTI